MTSYCPYKGNLISSEMVYNQHKRFLMAKNQDIYLREAFQQDLSNFVTTRKNERDQNILCVVLNEDTDCDNGPIQHTFLLKHKYKFQTPDTHNRGAERIDAIFVSKL